MSKPRNEVVKQSTLLAPESAGVVDEAIPDGQIYGWHLYVVQFWYARNHRCCD
jgi:hypothetical protein